MVDLPWFFLEILIFFWEVTANYIKLEIITEAFNRTAWWSKWRLFS